MKKKSATKAKSDSVRNIVSGKNVNITELVKKSDLNAKNEFEYNKIVRKNERFLDCTYVDGKESVTFEYKVNYERNWSHLAKERKDLVVRALIDAGRLVELSKDYCFELNPNNLFYDLQGRVYIKSRDIYLAEKEFVYEDFIREYKALVGCTIGKKYKYEDYLRGGIDLLKEDSILKQIYEVDDVATIDRILREELERYNQTQLRKFVKVDRKKYKTKNIAFVLAILIALSTTAFAGYFSFYVKPYQEAVISANEAYLVSDYNGVVEALKDVKVLRMNSYQKYILAIASIRCESFSNDTMKNILATVNTNSDEKLMEYWIYINRLNTDKAQDIAMQLSNDQLLYYAYLKEKAVVSNDDKMSGEKKSQKLSELDSKLKPLEDEYSKLLEETSEEQDETTEATTEATTEEK